MEIHVDKKRIDKKNIIVLIGPWKSPFILFNRIKKEIPKNFGYIHYYYTGDILNSDPHLTKKYCLKLMKQIVHELKELSKTENKNFYLYAQSLGGIFCAYTLDKIDVKKFYVVVPGDIFAECVWNGEETKEIVKEMKKNGMTLAKLKILWKDLSAHSHLKGKAKNVDYFIKLSVKDHVVPYKNGVGLVKLMKKKGYNVQASEGVLPHIETCLYESLFPERAIKFLTE